MGGGRSLALRRNLDGRYIGVIDRYGKPTQAGRFFYETVRGEGIPDARFDPNATTYRYPQGRTDYVKTRAGVEIVLRTWNPTKKQIDYTTAGKQFYANRPRQYIVQVPCKVFVRRRDGTVQSFYGTYPASDFNEEIRNLLLNVTGSTVQAQRRIQREVLNHLNGRGVYQGLRVIAEFSDQTICYNPDGEWSYAYMQTNFDEAGNVESHGRSL